MLEHPLRAVVKRPVMNTPTTLVPESLLMNLAGVRPCAFDFVPKKNRYAAACAGTAIGSLLPDVGVESRPSWDY